MTGQSHLGTWSLSGRTWQGKCQERREERGERREEREGHCQGEGLRPPVRGEKAAPGVVLGATFLNVYFMPESGEAEDLF